MQGKVVLITGSTAGIGRAAAVSLAGQGANVTIMGRDAQRCQKVAAEIKAQAGAGEVEWLACDLASFPAVRKSAEEFKARHSKLDVLCLNAGAFIPTRQVNESGVERVFAFSYLGHFLLEQLLLPLLQAAGEARIVVTAVPPRGMKVLYDDINLDKGYSSLKAMTNAKAAMITHTLDMAERFRDKGITANFFQPGIVKNTELMLQMPAIFRGLVNLIGISPARGADTLVYLASAPEVKGVTGEYFRKRKARGVSGPVTDRANWTRLWDLSAKLTGL